MLTWRQVVRLGRLAGWAMLPLIIGYILSGYTLTGKYGLDRVIPMGAAHWIHLKLDPLLIALFTTHVTIQICVSLRRRGWLTSGKRREETQKK
ncbi:MAG: hypothetical protein DRO11_03025 [Methanobacteriota archaeon]|nr:MAG: hypothetical protein DRO11_03025 [Euryarchaeota archaeon]